MAAEPHKALRDLAWSWDPIGLGSEWRNAGEDEYDCLIEEALRILREGMTVSELAVHLEMFLREHFGSTPQPEQAALFANGIWEWWQRGLGGP
jgi:hypothetical protein